jgi:hypothetical protein
MTTTVKTIPERRAVAVRARIALDDLAVEAGRLYHLVNRLPATDDELAELERLTARARVALDTLKLS